MVTAFNAKIAKKW